jgi:FG-GAP-like repeat
MRPAMSCARLAVILAIPAVAFPSSLSFQNHTQPNNQNYGGGAPLYFHEDLNGDGYEDLVFAYHPEFGDQDTFVVQLAKGDGTYGAPVSYKLPAYGYYVNWLVLGDYSSDGYPDIIALGANAVYVYINDGHGAFTLGSTINFASNSQEESPTGVAGDFNHDNKLDLAFVAGGYLYVWFGTGTGSLNIGPSMGVHGDTPQLGDFDGDGKADLLLRDNVNYNVAYVLYGDGSGNFLHTTTITFNTPSTATQPESVVHFSAGDVNSDGKSDILATQPLLQKNRVFVYYGDTSRQFASRTSILIGRCIDNAASVADLDGNGYNDLIVQEHDCSNPNTGPLYVDVLTRNSNSSYNPDQTVYWAQSVNGVKYQLPYPPEVLRANTDSKPDLLVTQCADDRCDGYLTTTQFNTTEPYNILCYPPNGTHGINVCTPPAGPQYSTSSPVTFNIGASGSVPQRDVEVWIDGKKVAEQIDGFSDYTFLYQTLAVSPGQHQVDVYAAGWDQSTQRKSFTLWIQ